MFGPLIVCHCKVVKRAQIVEAVRDLLAADPSAPLEPQHVYKELQRRGRCYGCFPTVRSIVVEILEGAMLDVEGADVLTTWTRKHLMRKDDA